MDTENFIVYIKTNDFYNNIEQDIRRYELERPLQKRDRKQKGYWLYGGRIK